MDELVEVFRLLIEQNERVISTLEEVRDEVVETRSTIDNLGSTLEDVKLELYWPDDHSLGAQLIARLEAIEAAVEP